MSVAIRGNGGDLIWLDATLEFSRQYSADVTKHPTETGSNITDHVIMQNPKFRVRGVITDADFNTNRPVSPLGNYSGDELAEQATYTQFLNNTPVFQTPTITFGRNPLTDLLPASVAQVLGTDHPTVQVYENSKAFDSRACFAKLKEMFDLRKTVDVVFYRPSGDFEVYNDMIMTGLSETLDADSGDASYPDMTFEHVSYAASATAKIPKNLVKNAASSKKSKGKVQTTNTSKTYDFIEEQQKQNEALSAKDQQQLDAEVTVKDTKK